MCQLKNITKIVEVNQIINSYFFFVNERRSKVVSVPVTILIFGLKMKDLLKFRHLTAVLRHVDDIWGAISSKQ